MKGSMRLRTQPASFTAGGSTRFGGTKAQWASVLGARSAWSRFRVVAGESQRDRSTEKSKNEW